MPEYETLTGTEPNLNRQHEPRTILRDKELMMTEIADGLFVEWGECRKCNKRVSQCVCKGGPVEAEYMQRWRNERMLKSFGERNIEPAATPTAVWNLMKTVQKAQDLAHGDSNDDEIDALREALEEALGLLGLDLPEGVDPDAEPEEQMITPGGSPAGTYTINTIENPHVDPDRPSAAEEHRDMLASRPLPTTKSVDDGLDAAIEAVKQQSEEDPNDAGF